MSFTSYAKDTSAFARGSNDFPRHRQVASPPSECSDDSPKSVKSCVSSWWDNIFEASDVLYLNRNKAVRESSIRRKLFHSPSMMGAVIHDSSTSASRGVTSKRTTSLQVQDQLWSQDRKLYGSRLNSSATFVEGNEDCISCHDALYAEPTSRSADLLDTTRTSTAPLKDGHIGGIPQSSLEKSGGLPERVSNAARPIQQSQDTPDLLNSSESEKNQVLYPSVLKIHAARLALNSGQEHFSSKGKLRPARQLQPSCAVSCKRCAIPRLSEHERLLIFKEFWNLQNHEKQWEFMFDCIAVFAPQRKSSIKGAKGEKSAHRVYSFEVDNRKRKVCKTMFLRTLCVCDSWINSALSHCNSHGVSAPDRRGKNVINS